MKKLTITLLTLIATALLPTFAYATSEMAFAERGSHCNVATTAIVISAMKADPMEQAVEKAVNSTTDPILASYYRDLYRASPTSSTELFVRSPDPYADAVNLALFGWSEPDSRC